MVVGREEVEGGITGAVKREETSPWESPALQHYIGEWREASRSGVLGAGIRARRLTGAVRRLIVTLLSHWGVFLEL